MSEFKWHDAKTEDPECIPITCGTVDGMPCVLMPRSVNCLCLTEQGTPILMVKDYERHGIWVFINGKLPWDTVKIKYWAYIPEAPEEPEEPMWEKIL